MYRQHVVDVNLQLKHSNIQWKCFLHSLKFVKKYMQEHVSTCSSAIQLRCSKVLWNACPIYLQLDTYMHSSNGKLKTIVSINITTQKPCNASVIERDSL